MKGSKLTPPGVQSKYPLNTLHVLILPLTLDVSSPSGIFQFASIVRYVIKA